MYMHIQGYVHIACEHVHTRMAKTNNICLCKYIYRERESQREREREMPACVCISSRLITLARYVHEARC
jgi:hypothetical protein